MLPRSGGDFAEQRTDEYGRTGSTECRSRSASIVLLLNERSIQNSVSGRTEDCGWTSYGVAQCCTRTIRDGGGLFSEGGLTMLKPIVAIVALLAAVPVPALAQQY